jgi:predicted enzyme related to lactoylglutathione lyase
MPTASGRVRPDPASMHPLHNGQSRNGSCHKDYSHDADIEQPDRATISRIAHRQRTGNQMITHLKFVSIPVRDQDRALAFYTEKLGFRVATDQPFDDKQRWIELRIGDSETRFVLFTPEGQEDRIGTFFNGSLACDDAEATYRQLKQRGVEFLSEPKKEPWGTYMIMKDIDGNQFVVGS